MFRVEEMFRREEKRFRDEGRAQGEKETKVRIIKNMIKDKFSINKIAEILGMKENEIKKIVKEMN